MVLATVLLAGVQASTAVASAPTVTALQAWQAKIAKVPQPSKGCFTSSYPKLQWQQTSCSYAQQPPMTPRPPGPLPFTVGGGGMNDLSAKAPVGTISSATGSFDSAVNLTSETSSGTANNYTLQLNTNPFVSPACSTSPNPGCRGWEQFVYWNTGSSGRLLIQYWMLFYNAPCPAGWIFFEFSPGDPISYCFRNNAGQVSGLANQPITNLTSLRLTGNATAAGDSVTFVAGGTATTAPGDNFLSASGGWDIAEFNVFGGPGGAEATFNAGATIKVRTLINYGGRDAPECRAVSFTGETSNLSFGTAAPAPTPPGPSIQFIEDTDGGMPADCMYAAAIGDTHQHTVAGLLYDFQASGDFVEAQVGPSFEVQTRKVSGAPTWPDASVNQSVGARMGKTEVALCEGKTLVVDGKATELPPGGSLWLSADNVNIYRVGNRYFFVDQDGNSVRIGVHSSYINVSVGLGAWPSKVLGLLGNPDNDVKRLEARDGTQFTVPVSFSDLYNRFGDSWRLDPAKSLLSVCGPQAEQGNPGRPFFARDLNPELRRHAELVCQKAKVPSVWLGACTLDVAVLGDKAAAAYVGVKPPVLTNP
ncbi:hypothetical protein Rhe02_17570 [Rhizocola hellebori]|uniref:VWFD domain-containing protein n=1 Tax=Rhizocola hellebori TaxID=1392758 RepID=A0A8J3Q4I8_9ACTN|nr:VWD domain-containing protein [Rhizocola hellebori]GIH03690.1 hypothetical protein Rhe02_17570 [Rhizocola hellebori]